MRVISGLFFAVFSAFCAQNDSFFIKNIDIYPVSGKEMTGFSVLIQDGKIADIGAKLVAPKGVKVVDGKGLRVYPGLIDSATNLGLAEYGQSRETIDTGEIGEFMPQLRALSAVNPESEHFGAVRVNGITSAITLPGQSATGGRGGGRAQHISGQAALIHTAGYTWEDLEISRSAAVQLNFPALGNRGGRGGFGAELADLLGDAAAGNSANARRTYEENLKKIDEFFDGARRYRAAKQAKTPDLKTDLALEAMIPVLDGKVPLAVSASTTEAMKDAISFADKQKVKIVIMGPRELGNMGPDLKSRNIPVVLGRTLALPMSEDDSYDSAMALPGQFYKAGVKIALGTFTNEFVRNLPFQAAAAVAFGLPPEEALKAVTINAAEIWGKADVLGSIEKGKYADLVITNGDILDVRSKIEHVYIKGREIELSNKQTRLYDKYMGRQ